MKYKLYLSTYCSLVIFFIILVSNIWVADDAYFTFRVVDNFVNGYGLRWNVDERVQVYTHPLWLLLHIPVYFLISNIYWATILLSLACVITGVWFWLKDDRNQHTQSNLIVFILPLLLSRTFKDFSVCGLENPLSFLLLVCFWKEYWNHSSEKLSSKLVFISSLLCLTRFDNCLIILPSIVLHLWKHKSKVRFSKLVLCTSPLAVWILFSSLYYGFILPNTMYAKLHSGISLISRIEWGITYTKSFFLYDPFSAIYVLVCALVIAVSIKTNRHAACLLAGCILHYFYILYVGGDFMSGRFFYPIFVSLTLYAAFISQNATFSTAIKRGLVILMLYAVHHYMLYPLSPYNRSNQYAGISDERKIYVKDTGLFNDPSRFIRNGLQNSTTQYAKKLREHAATQNIIVNRNFSGMLGYYSGAGITIIDTLALPEPLLARFPIEDNSNYRPGHYERLVPQGYFLARSTGNLSEMFPSLARYYEKLRLVTSAELLDTNRLYAILGFQLGLYDKWIRNYWFTSRLDTSTPIFINSQNSTSIISGINDPVLTNVVNTALDKLSSEIPNIENIAPSGIRTCSVVGNARNLLGSNYGEIIDNNQIVFRMGQATVYGHEKDVGMKTTYHVIDSGYKSIPDIDKNAVVILTVYTLFANDIDRFKNITSQVFPDSFPYIPNASVVNNLAAFSGRVRIMHPDFIRYMNRNWFTPDDLPIHKRLPSTGLKTLILAFHLCDKIDVFGFSKPNKQGVWDHYFEDSKVKAYDVHKPEFQTTLLEKLEKQKVIKFFSGVDTQN